MSTPKNNDDKHTHRGGLKKADSYPMTIPMPITWVTVIDSAVKAADTDRSKFFRAAIREKLERLSHKLPAM